MEALALRKEVAPESRGKILELVSNVTTLAGTARTGLADAFGIARRARRTRGLEYVYQEAKNAGAMFINSFNFDRERYEKARATSRYRKAVILAQGFLAHVDYYNRLLLYFHHKGIMLIFPQNLVRNKISWSESDRILSDTIKAAEDKTGFAPDLVCHSRGCLDGLRMIPAHPEIESIFTIAGPFRGLSHDFLVAYMKFWWYGNPGHAIDPAILKNPEILKKIVNIYSTADCIVTPEEASLPGVRQEIVINEKNVSPDPKRARWNTHTGLPIYVQRDIVQELHGTAKAA